MDRPARHLPGPEQAGDRQDRGRSPRGWLAGGDGTYVNAVYQSVSTGQEEVDGFFGTGSILRHFEDELPAGPIYCLDLFHSFSDVTTTWDVERRIVPPDSSNPPPWNMDQAAFAYQFEHYSYEAEKAAGLQLALWEISHEQGWWDAFTYGGWFVHDGTYNSEFWAMVNTNTGTKGYYASEILQYVKLNFETAPATSAHYYYPVWVNPDYEEDAQGFIGDGPEPGTLMMFGAGLLFGAGTAWRRRRRQPRMMLPLWA